MVKYLIFLLVIQSNLLFTTEYKPDIKKTHGCDSPLSLAIRRKDIDAIKWLLDHGSKVNDSLVYHSIFQPAYYSPIDIRTGIRPTGVSPIVIETLLTHSALAHFNKAKIITEALSYADINSPEIIKTLLALNFPTDIKIVGIKPLVYIDSKIARLKQCLEKNRSAEDLILALDQTEETRKLLIKHEQLKLRWVWVRGLVQIERAGDLQHSRRVAILDRIPIVSTKDQLQ